MHNLMTSIGEKSFFQATLHPKWPICNENHNVPKINISIQVWQMV